MKRALLSLGLAASVSAAPAHGASLYLGHGIPGPNGLPVDVCLVTDGGLVPLATGVTYKSITDAPLELDAGRYDVEIRLSDGACGSPTVAVVGSIFLGLGENATAIAHLTEQGTPTITKYVNDFRPLMDGKTRIYARHAAAVGNVDVMIRQPGKYSRYFRGAVIRGLENPEQEGADLRAGSYQVSISPSGSRHPVFSAELPLEEGVGYFAYAVGNPADDSFTVLLQSLPID